jgi:hypothetical protein
LALAAILLSLARASANPERADTLN